MSFDGKPVTIFAALEPDRELAALVSSFKDQVRALVGEQTYLADPPHLTVYLAEFSAIEAALAAWPRVAAAGDGFCLTLVGWHIFEADALTGTNTVVCEIAREDKSRLRNLQQQVVERLAPVHDPAATRQRLAPRMQFLTGVQRQRVESHGFPYLGDDWQPHFTIASIRQADWLATWAALEPQAPRGPFRCERLRLYRLNDGKFVAIDGLGS